MTWRILTIISGVGVVASATHANIVHVGGYKSVDAPIIITLAILLSVGMGFCGALWANNQRAGAFVLVVCIICGEAYWTLSNAERELAAREVRDAPTQRAIETRVNAERREADAAQALKDANAAVTESAAKKDCARNCSVLLAAAVTAATTELAEARQALSKTPRPLSPAPLPARLGIAPWLWDLIMAGLRSLAVLGGSLAVGLATHSRRPTAVEPSEAGKPAKSVATTAKRKTSKRLLGSSSTRSARDHAAEFGIRCLRADPEAEARIDLMHERYRRWCAENDYSRLPPPELAQELSALFSSAGLPVEDRGGGELVVRGVKLV